MTVEIFLKNAKGEVEAYATGDAVQPLQWKSPPGKPITINRGGNNGVYKLHHFTYNPGITLELGGNYIRQQSSLPPIESSNPKGYDPNTKTGGTASFTVTSPTRI